MIICVIGVCGEQMVQKQGVMSTNTSEASLHCHYKPAQTKTRSTRVHVRDLWVRARAFPHRAFKTAAPQSNQLEISSFVFSPANCQHLLCCWPSNASHILVSHNITQTKKLPSQTQTCFKKNFQNRSIKSSTHPGKDPLH